MGQPIVLADRTPDVDPKRIGISYSGGGPLVVIELGIAQAFIERKVVPRWIAGASAGALAGMAHAADPIGGTGVRVAAGLLGSVTNRTVGLGLDQVLGRAILQRHHLQGLGDHSGLRPLLERGLAELGIPAATIGTFQGRGRARLQVVATNRRDGTSVWFPDSTAVTDALMASVAIPGVFPWQVFDVGGKTLTLVDGGVVLNQPLSRLVVKGCGTIFACAVGYVGGAVPPPTNALDNALQSLSITIHQSTKLEEDYVRLKLGGAGTVHHIHPEVNMPDVGFNFTPAMVESVMEESRVKTVAWLEKLGY